MRIGLMIGGFIALLLWLLPLSPVTTQSAEIARVTPIGTPTPTPIAAYLPLIAHAGSGLVPIPTPTPIPNQGTITVRNTSSEYQTSSYWVYGEVLSTLDVPVSSVKIIGTFYDASNAFVATDYTYTTMDVVYPNQPTPFALLVFNPPPGIVRQTLTTTYSALSSFHKVPVTVITTLVRDSNGPEVYGMVRNDQVVPLKFVKAAATFYNSAGNVIYVDYNYTPTDPLPPGATDVYQISTFRSGLPYSRFTVLSEGSPP